jgi:transposase
VSRCFTRQGAGSMGTAPGIAAGAHDRIAHGSTTRRAGDGALAQRSHPQSWTRLRRDRFRTGRRIVGAQLMLGLPPSVTDLANRLAKLEHENAQLKKAVLGSPSERSKMPRIKTGAPSTPEEQRKTRKERAAAKAQTPTVRVEHKVPDDQRCCKVCGNTKLDPLGDGKKTRVFEFVPARFLRVEHVQEVLRCRCNSFIVTSPGAPKVVEKGQYGAWFLAHLAVAKCADHTPDLPTRKGFPPARRPHRALDDERVASPRVGDPRADLVATSRRRARSPRRRGRRNTAAPRARQDR